LRVFEYTRLVEDRVVGSECVLEVRFAEFTSKKLCAHDVCTSEGGLLEQALFKDNVQVASSEIRTREDTRLEQAPSLAAEAAKPRKNCIREVAFLECASQSRA
jgi:hypothetical protein